MIQFIRNWRIFQTVTNMKRTENKGKFTKVSLATLILTYQPRVALQSLSKQNAVSSAEGLDMMSSYHSLAQ
jgi:hypothetical protein